jgi:hypothetical protein
VPGCSDQFSEEEHRNHKLLYRQTYLKELKGNLSTDQYNDLVAKLEETEEEYQKINGPR